MKSGLGGHLRAGRARWSGRARTRWRGGGRGSGPDGGGGSVPVHGYLDHGSENLEKILKAARIRIRIEFIKLTSDPHKTNADPKHSVADRNNWRR